MFKIVPRPTFEAVAKIPVAGDKAADLTLVFKHKTRDETKDFFERASKSDSSDGAILGEIVDGWKGVDTEFSPEAMTQLCQNYHGAVPAIFDAYLTELTKARAKN